MRKLAGVKHRTFSNSKFFKLSISPTLELSSSTGCFKLKLQTSAVVEFDRPSNLERLRLKVCKFEGSTNSNFESSNVRRFESSKV